MSDDSAGATPAPQCTECQSAQLENGWCDTCAVGYVAARAIPSRLLWETLDAHGHEIDATRLRCEECQRAVVEDGFCERTGFGFVDGQLYYSRLTYGIARGRPLVLPGLACADCRRGDPNAPWCERCDRGMVGNVAFDDPQARADAAAAFADLTTSLTLLESCEMCSIAHFTGARCPTCQR